VQPTKESNGWAKYNPACGILPGDDHGANAHLLNGNNNIPPASHLPTRRRSGYDDQSPHRATQYGTLKGYT